MIRVCAFVTALMLTACGRQVTPAPAIESVDELVANPQRLSDLRQRCRLDHRNTGEAQCAAVAEATRKVFMGNGTPYTPLPAAAAAFAASGPASGASR